MGPYENPSGQFSVLSSVLEWTAYNNHGVRGERGEGCANAVQRKRSIEIYMTITIAAK